MATRPKFQTDLFESNLRSAELIPNEVNEDLQTLLTAVLLRIVRSRPTHLQTKEGANDQNHT